MSDPDKLFNVNPAGIATFGLSDFERKKLVNFLWVKTLSKTSKTAPVPTDSVSPQSGQPLEVLYEDPKEDMASIISEVSTMASTII